MFGIACALLYQKLRVPSVLLVPLTGIGRQHARLLNNAGVTARALSGSSTAGDRVELRQLFQEQPLQALVVSPEALCRSASLVRVLNERPGGITAFDEAHLWADAADWRPTLSLAATRLQGRRRLALTGSLRTGKEDQLADILRMTSPVIGRGKFVQANLILRIMPRPPAFCPSFFNLLAQIAAEEDWCWRLAYVTCWIVDARRKDGNVIIYARSQKINEQLVTARKASVQRRVARVGGALPSVYAYHAGCKTRAAVELAFCQLPGVVVVSTVAFGLGIHCAHVRTVVHCVSGSTIDSLSCTFVFCAT